VERALGHDGVCHRQSEVMHASIVPAVEPDSIRTSLSAFVTWRKEHLIGDEKGEAALYLERLFTAFGHAGIREAGATLEARIRRLGAGVSYADLLWKPRCLVEMKRQGTDLTRHYRQAFQYWVEAVPERPRYVVLCNFDEFWIYVFDQQLDEPVEKLDLDDLPHRFEALAFLLPDEQTPIFGNDLVAVTRKAAAQVSGVFRQLHGRGVERVVAQHFVLQSVVAMFAEDIGLLPGRYFTRALEDSAHGRDVYDLLGGLFREMNTAGRTSGGRYQGTPYFNGGLFERIEPIELTDDELVSMREAASTNWAAVRPEIFGTLFETSMDADERHAYGAHFTSQTDIAKVVLPTIVKPWTERIVEAKTVNEIERLLLDMAAFRVLDPACGSGNFLYVAYREMRRLEQEAKLRLQERRRAARFTDQVAFSYVTPDHFLGLDANPFAVEVAKVTMMLAKKLAADELDETQDVLPLDNLDDTIRHADALFTPWPEAHVIIGNPPYMGRRKMDREMGLAYTQRLAREYPNIGGVSDFVTYWFPLTHDALPEGGRAGLVATQAVRDASSRVASLDYVVDHDGVIFDAVSSQPWSGDAAVTVSIINWVKGSAHAPEERILWLDKGELRLAVDHIPASLRPSTDVRRAQPLACNRRPKVCWQGQTTGFVEGYRLSREEASAIVARDPGSREVIHPMIGGDSLIHGPVGDTFVIDIPESDRLMVEAQYPGALNYLRGDVLSHWQEAATAEGTRNAELLAANPGGRPVTTYADFLNRSWWMHWRRRADMVRAITALPRYLALTIVAAEGRKSIYEFVDPVIRPDASLQVFALDDDYSFGVLSSSLHRRWFDERCSRLETRPRYTPTTVWDYFPWPADPSHESVAAIASLSAKILDLRESFIALDMTLGNQYDTLREPGRSELRDLHDALDDAVLDAYGFTREDDVLAQLLALNLAAAAEPGLARRPGGAEFDGAYTSTYRLTAEPL
jgi:hypothetical protein